MLVEFPSVVNAVACAADIQRRMRERNVDVPEDRRIEFRIGVNLGDIIVEDNDIYGDGVNIAARIEGIAKPAVRLPEVAGPSWLRMRMTVVRGFAGYLHTIDSAHEIIPAGLIAVHVGRAVPYLYSDNDTATLMTEAERLDTPLRRATIATVIGLLAVTGMRIGEVHRPRRHRLRPRPAAAYRAACQARQTPPAAAASEHRRRGERLSPAA